jgi:ribosomal protein S12 methylthiotransferase accessory factor
MTRNHHMLTIAARDLATGGVLLTINDDRRIEVHRSLAEVWAALGSGEASGFLGELGDLVSQSARRASSVATEDRRVLIHVDRAFRHDAGSALLEDFRSSTPSAVVLDDDLLPILGANDVLVTMHELFNFERLTRLQDVVEAANARWAPFWRDAASARFGPFRHDRRSPSVRDLAARWVSAASKESHGRALLSPAAAVMSSTPVMPLESAYEIAVFLHDVSLWLAGGRPRAWWHTVRLDRTGDVTVDPVLPMPERETHASPRDSGLSPLDVVNARTGIVVRLRDVTFRTAMPSSIRYVESQTADMARLRSWASNIYNAGSSWRDYEQARAGAVGEAVERYCGNVVDHSRLVFGSFNELTRRGARVLDPHEFVLFSEEQYSDPRFPFVPFERSTRAQWIVGRSLADDAEVLVPAALTFVNWNTGRSLFSPRTNPAYYPGIAAATTPEAALANALEEVVERDAAMVWWWSGHRLPVAGDAAGALERLMPAVWSREHEVHAHVTPLTNAVGLPAVAVAVEAQLLGLLTVGFAARRTAEEATEKALLEALGLLETALDMQDPQGGFWRTYQPGQSNGAVRPVRDDRLYLDSYRADFRDVTDLCCQLQIQLDPRSHNIVQGRFGDLEPTVMARMPRLARRDHREYVDVVMAAGFEPVAVDLTNRTWRRRDGT